MASVLTKIYGLACWTTAPALSTMRGVYVGYIPHHFRSNCYKSLLQVFSPFNVNHLLFVGGKPRGRKIKSPLE
jgi:hypothetical protein